MRKHSIFILSIITTLFFPSALHTAASSNFSSLIASSFTSTSKGSQIVQEPDFNFELVSNDAKSFLINAEIAAEYSATLCSMREVRIALESQKLASGMTQVIDVDVSSKLMSVFTTIINWANYQKQYLKTVSAWKLSNELDIKTQMTEFDVPDYQTFFALLDLYETKPIITDVVAVFTLQHLGKNTETFREQLNTFASSPISKNALKKQIFLSQRHPTLPKKWHKWHGVFYTSVQDCIDHPKYYYRCRSFTMRYINDLAGIQHLAEVKGLNLDLNFIDAIPANAFVNFTHLKDLSLWHNQIVDIEPAAFTGLVKLERLSLSDNRITFIDPRAFTGLVNLRELHLGGNQISVDEQARIEEEVKSASPHAEIYW